MIAGAVYLLCCLTALGCGVLLLRAYLRSRLRLLLWSGLCFIGLALNNALVFADIVLLPEVDLFLLRNVAAAVAMGLLLYGLILDSGR